MTDKIEQLYYFGASVPAAEQKRFRRLVADAIDAASENAIYQERARIKWALRSSTVSGELPDQINTLTLLDILADNASVDDD